MITSVQDVGLTPHCESGEGVQLEMFSVTKFVFIDRVSLPLFLEIF